MGEPRKIYSSETIGGHDAATNTRGILITNQVHRIEARGHIIHGIHICIRGRLRKSVDGRYR